MSRNPYGRAVAAPRHLKLRRIQSRHGGAAFPRPEAAATAFGLLLLLLLASAARAQLCELIATRLRDRKLLAPDGVFELREGA